MNRIAKRFSLVSAYAVAMAYVESAAVVYLRGLLNVTDTHVVLGHYIRAEIGREAATIAMLVTAGWMVGRNWRERVAYGLFAFGLWDIWYYVWLKVLINWPSSLFSLDLLFMIPLRWWGPVLAPVLIAALICVCAVFAVIRLERGEGIRVTPARAVTVILGGLLGLYVFMDDSILALVHGLPDWSTVRPGPFNWALFLVALATMALPSLAATWPFGSVGSIKARFAKGAGEAI